MSKKKKAEKTGKQEQEILIVLEEYLQEKQTAEFSDLSALLRAEHKELYMTFVKYHEYFKSLMLSYQKKNGILIPEQEEQKERPVLQIGKHIYNLNTAIGESDYRDFLYRVVLSYPFDIDFAQSHRKNLFYVLKNGREIMAVCSVKEAAEECADSMNRLHTDDFYDVCWWNKRNVFKNLHFQNS